MNPHRYSNEEIAVVERAIRERRDMRHFLPDLLPDGLVERLVDAAHHAPSVGYMQPWRFVRVRDAERRAHIHALVEEERLATAAALPSRNEEFMQVKIEGIRDCAELLVVALMPERERHLIGRRTLPEMDIASVGCAIQNMWLLARTEVRRHRLGVVLRPRQTRRAVGDAGRRAPASRAVHRQGARLLPASDVRRRRLGPAAGA